MSLLQTAISALILWLLSGLADLQVPTTLSYWQPVGAAQALSDCRQGLTAYAMPGDPGEADRGLRQKPPQVLARHFSLAIWNAHKLQQPGWRQELQQLSEAHDLLLLQEIIGRAELSALLPQHYAPLLQAFTLDGRATGVMTASRAAPQALCGLRSVEPWIGVPKSALVSEYELMNGRTLLVINLHSINFVWDLEAYQQQLTGITALVAAHTGAVVVAGDFNSWRSSRQLLLQQQLQGLGLTEAIPEPDLRRRFLGEAIDQIWVRGLQVVSARSMPSRSSDHNMVSVALQLE